MKKIGVLVENRFIDQEVIYYQNRFPEAGVEVDFMTRLWGQPRLTFKGMELGMELTADKSFEDLDDWGIEKYAAFIVPAGYVSDMLLYAETPGELSPAAVFVKKLMSKPEIIKAAICHSLWLWTPIPECLKGRHVTCHNNIYGSVKNTGAVYVDEDIVTDGDLITARTGGMFAALAKTILQKI